jgi:hypothetical protein
MRIKSIQRLTPWQRGDAWSFHHSPIVRTYVYVGPQALIGDNPDPDGDPFSLALMSMGYGYNYNDWEFYSCAFDMDTYLVEDSFLPPDNDF